MRTGHNNIRTPACHPSFILSIHQIGTFESFENRFDCVAQRLQLRWKIKMKCELVKQIMIKRTSGVRRSKRINFSDSGMYSARLFSSHWNHSNKSLEHKSPLLCTLSRFNNPRSNGWVNFWISVVGTVLSFSQIKFNARCRRSSYRYLSAIIKNPTELVTHSFVEKNWRHSSSSKSISTLVAIARHF